MSKRVCLYSRVSTEKQTCENQLIELRQTAERLGYTVVQEYVDHAISGMKGRDERPSLDRMLKDASTKKFEMVMIFDITRLGRSLQHCVETLNYLNSIGVDLFFQKQSIDTSTPVGRLTFSLLASLGEYERELIRERIIAGVNRAKESGKKLGRPSSVTDGMKNAIQILRDKGMGIVAISRQLNCGVGTIYKVIGT